MPEVDAIQEHKDKTEKARYVLNRLVDSLHDTDLAAVGPVEVTSHPPRLVLKIRIEDFFAWQEALATLWDVGAKLK